MRALPRGIWVLGLVSMFMDISSEMIHGLLPVYLVTVLGASALTVGVIEGVAEAIAQITKIFSGALSDWLGRRKLPTAIGYGLAALSKPIFALASTVAWVVAARFIDRIGKGIRGAPRDALIADIAPPDRRGASFGLRQALDTAGAVLGPLVAVALMAISAGNYRLVFWTAVAPALVAFGLITLAVREPKGHGKTDLSPRLRWPDVRRLPTAYWCVVAVGFVLTLARFSEAFLILRSQDVGFKPGHAPFVLVVMNIVYALAAYPAGALSDRLGRAKVLAGGMGLLILADVVLALGTGAAAIMIGVAIWGLHLALTQGLFASLVADTAPANLRGTAFGVYNFAAGIAMLAASVLAGLLWDSSGPQATFLAGAAFTAVALLGLRLVAKANRARSADSSMQP
jgi:MFS family permease